VQKLSFILSREFSYIDLRMKFHGTVLLLAGLWTWVRASVLPIEPKGNRTYVPNAYIVQLDSQSQNSLLSPSSVFSEISGRNGYQIRREFTNPKYFYGVSLTVSPNTTLSDLQQIEGVQNVWPLGVVSRPAPFQVLTTPFTPPKGGSSNVTIPHITGNSAVNTPLAMAEVDKLHNLGIKGRGVKLAIIDSGVDYLHPSLGGGFGPGFKISFGYDFVGDDYTGFNDPVPDSDPLATCASGGHGTHVTGNAIHS
jgi:subtilisin family serine protease